MSEVRLEIVQMVQAVIYNLFGVEESVEVTVPESDFGDYSTNAALKLASKIGKSPREIATQISDALSAHYMTDVAGPGFINLTLPDSILIQQITNRTVQLYGGESIVVEYSCPNYFKELHAGHLYQTIYGDVIARMLERSGAVVHRTNFGADVGLSAARALWGIIQHIGGEDPEKLNLIPVSERTKFIAASYVDGARADSDSEHARQEIADINKRIYALHSESDTTSGFARIYFTCREWCRQYFEQLYADLKVDPFERYYPESSTEAMGRRLVKEHTGTLFTESQGAVVYAGEADGLHTRVFITRDGLPTYETKDLGLIFIELADFKFTKRVLVTGKEQTEYMKVVWRVAGLIRTGLDTTMIHQTNGLVRFGDGQKMSSRTGNVTTAMDVINSVKEAVGSTGDTSRDEQIYLGALKYEFLKHRLGSDIAFDPHESVSLHGNSGPYLQYALVRARSILDKKTGFVREVPASFEQSERKLAQVLSRYAAVLERATIELAPHLICTYLYELAQEFNRFYEENKVIGSEREQERIWLVSEYAITLAHGLDILGMQSPEKM